jgi:hypothetical protein
MAARDGGDTRDGVSTGVLGIRLVYRVEVRAAGGSLHNRDQLQRTEPLICTYRLGDVRVCT